MNEPIFIPNVEISEIEVNSEKAVARALKRTLDSSWTIFHSYCWLRSQGDKKKRLVEGEADFVLVHRQWGLFVLEVKGGEVEFNPDTGRWRQNRDTMKKCPFKQGEKNMYALIDQIHERLGKFVGRTFGKGMPCPFGYMVCFPDCSYSGDLPPGGHPSTTFSAHDLPDLGAKIKSAAKHWAATASPGQMEPKDFQALKKALKSDFKIVPSLARRIEQDEEQLIQLTDEQAEKLEGLYQNRRVAVEGVAGSGKTLLALHRSRSLASEGKHVLFLTYNKKLAEALASRNQDVDTLKIINFHTLCHQMCERASLPFNVPSDPSKSEEFWGKEVAELLMEAADELPETRYDAIIVDEAQDFKEDWWTAIEFLHRESNGYLYIFYDRAQNLFARNLVFPGTDVHYDLKVNCRNTKEIAKSCGGVLGAEIKTSRFAPDGKPPLVINLSNAEDIRKQCKSILTQVIGNEKINPSRVAILSTKGIQKSCLSAGKIGNYDLTDHVDVWQNGKAVWFSSLKAFKGLEADVLLIIEVDGFHEKYFTKHDLYVGASRARHQLIVFSKSKEIKAALLGDAK